MASPDSNKPPEGPFLGHQGIGFRVTARKNSGTVLIQDSILNHLVFVFVGIAFAPGLNLMMIARWPQLRRESSTSAQFWLGIIVLTALSGVGWYLSTQGLHRLRQRRRIEITSEGLSFLKEDIASIYRVSYRVSKDAILSLEILETRIDLGRRSVKNYLLQLQKTDGEILYLCISDSRQNLETVRDSIAAIIPGVIALE